MLQRFFFTVVLYDVLDKIPTSSQKIYFQALENPQKLERVFFFLRNCANLRARIKNLFYFIF